jgi:DNA ligase D-like protein (predicted 3'-phosphoesterase)
MTLSPYQKRRDFSKTPEPDDKRKNKTSSRTAFVIQKHQASHLHFDFRIEIKGVLKSWAIPKGPSVTPKDKRLAILTEDHPKQYGNFEGVIPEGEYGAGVVMLWDKGTYKNTKKDSSGKIIPIETCFLKGRIEICLKGKRLKGGYALIRFRGNNWLLVKMQDEFAKSGSNPVSTQLRSVKTNRTMNEIKKATK